MYSISPGQIKAARSLLDWTQDELAQASGVSPKTIAKLEGGENITLTRLLDIRKSLEGEGIEFLGNKGVIRNTDKPIIYSGPEGCEQFYEDMLVTAKEKGGEIIAVYETSNLLARSLGIADDSNLERLTSLSKYASIKCLLTDARQASLTIPCVEFRAIAPQQGIWSVFQCGDRHTLVYTRGNGDFWFYGLKSIDIALAETKLFTTLWNNGLPLAIREPSQPPRR